MLSKTCQYAIQGVIYIALKSDENRAIGLKEIAESQGMPTHFLGKVLQALVKKGVLKSIKGPNGGFHLAREPKDISLMDVYDIIDGIEFFDKCVLGFDECTGSCPCPLHSKYEKIKLDMLEFLNKTFEEICLDIQAGNSFVAFNKLS